MDTPFGDRQWRRNHQLPLSEFPAWGLEIMMGLYGPETVKSIRAEEETGAAVPDAAPEAHRPRLTDGAWHQRLDSYTWASDPTRGNVTSTRRHPTAPRHVEPMTPISIQIEAVNQLVHYLERKFKRH